MKREPLESLKITVKVEIEFIFAKVLNFYTFTQFQRLQMASIFGDK